MLGWRAAVLLLIVALFAPVIFIVWSMKASWDATFSVEAQTEVLSFETGKINVPNWFVGFNRLRIDGQDMNPSQTQLSIEHDVRVTLRRPETGQLLLHIESLANGTAASLFDLADEPLSQANTSLQGLIDLPEGGALTLPLAGRAVIGETVFSQVASTSPVLLEGQVEVFGVEFFGENRFSASQAELSSGDRLEIRDQSDTASGHGLIRVDPSSRGMNVVFHADGDSARIVRFGTAGYELSPSLWSGISSDPFFRNLLAIYAALLPALAVASTTILSHWKMRKLAKMQMNRDCEELMPDDDGEDRKMPSSDKVLNINEEQRPQ